MISSSNNGNLSIVVRFNYMQHQTQNNETMAKRRAFRPRTIRRSLIINGLPTDPTNAEDIAEAHGVTLDQLHRLLKRPIKNGQIGYRVEKIFKPLRYTDAGRLIPQRDDGNEEVVLEEHVQFWLR